MKLGIRIVLPVILFITLIGCEKEDDNSFPQVEIKSPVILFQKDDGKELHAVFEGHAGWDVITVDPDGNIWFGGKYTFWPPHCWNGEEMTEYTSYESLHESLADGDRYYFTRREIYE